MTPFANHSTAVRPEPQPTRMLGMWSRWFSRWFSRSVASPPLISLSAESPGPMSPGPVMMALSILVLTVFIGCDSSKKKSDRQGAGENIVSSVPLRIVSAADESLNNRIVTAWKAISEQPIALVASSNEELLENALKSDVVIFSNYQMGNLQSVETLSALPEVLLGAEGLDTSSILPALASDSLRWGPDVYALPLGTVYPALWYNENLQLNPQPNWEDYAQLLDSLEPGQASEPLAEGWAAVSFLWRAATMTREMWLFDRQTFEPQIATAPYVQALEQMIAARSRYPQKLMTPAEIWQALETGDLQAAIAWPTVDLNDASENKVQTNNETLLTLASYPMSGQVFLGDWTASDGRPQPPVLSPYGLSVGIATSCRQTPAARAFVRWIASREGHASIRGGGNYVLPHRVLSIERDARETIASGAMFSADAERSNFDAYLTDMLARREVRPSLRIPGAQRYLETLDRHILAALSGERSAESALLSVAQEWIQLTEELGRSQQINAWRQSQGMRER